MGSSIEDVGLDRKLASRHAKENAVLSHPCAIKPRKDGARQFVVELTVRKKGWPTASFEKWMGRIEAFCPGPSAAADQGPGAP